MQMHLSSFSPDIHDLAHDVELDQPGASHMTLVLTLSFASFIISFTTIYECTL